MTFFIVINSLLRSFIFIHYAENCNRLHLIYCAGKKIIIINFIKGTETRHDDKSNNDEMTFIVSITNDGNQRNNKNEIELYFVLNFL